MTAPPPAIGLVVPVYDEAERLAEYGKALLEFIARQPTGSEAARLRDSIDEMTRARDDLASLRAHARNMERTLTGTGQTFEEFMDSKGLLAFQRLPGAQAWSGFETVLARAEAEINQAISDAQSRIDTVAPVRSPPIQVHDLNPFKDDVDDEVPIVEDRAPLPSNKPLVGEKGPSTNPFDDDYVAPPSTNPFDDNYVEPKSNNPFDT